MGTLHFQRFGYIRFPQHIHIRLLLVCRAELLIHVARSVGIHPRRGTQAGQIEMSQHHASQCFAGRFTRGNNASVGVVQGVDIGHRRLIGHHRIGPNGFIQNHHNRARRFTRFGTSGQQGVNRKHGQIGVAVLQSQQPGGIIGLVVHQLQAQRMGTQFVAKFRRTKHRVAGEGVQRNGYLLAKSRVGTALLNHRLLPFRGDEKPIAGHTDAQNNQPHDGSH